VMGGLAELISAVDELSETLAQFAGKRKAGTGKRGAKRRKKQERGE
jgi:hypothetical protein